MGDSDQALQRNKDFAATCAHEEASNIARHRGRIAQNGRIFDLELTGGERAQLDALDLAGGTGNAL